MDIALRASLQDVGEGLTWRSWVTLITFAVVNALVILPLPIPIPFACWRACQRVLVRLRLSDGHKLTAHRLGGANAHDAFNGEKPALARAGSDGSPVQPSRRKHFYLDLTTAPFIGVLFLLATTSIQGHVVRIGIAGDGSPEGLRPFDVMILFICFAYISISLDQTGLLRYLAAWVAQKSSTSGTRLYNAFYVFFAVVGMLVGNDPSILSGTPFLVYFTRIARITDPTAYLFTHFQVSNLVSALLVSSNPTNLVLTAGFDLSFLQFSAWTALPTVAAVVVMYPILRFVYRGGKMIPHHLGGQGDSQEPEADPRSELKDPVGGIFGATLFLCVIVLLVGLSAGNKLHAPLGVWTVCAPGAAIMLIRDLVGDHLRHTEKRSAEDRGSGEKKIVDAGAAEGETPAAEKTAPVEPARPPVRSQASADAGSVARSNSVEVIPHVRVRPRRQSTSSSMQTATATVATGQVLTGQDPSLTSEPQRLDPVDESRDLEGNTPNDAKSTSPNELIPPPPEIHFPPLFSSFTAHFPTVSYTFSRLPLNLVLFAFSMFVLVEALSSTGWIHVWGGWWTVYAGRTGLAGSMFLMALLSVVGCCLFGTNIGATVLLSRVLQEWQARVAQGGAQVDKRVLYGSVFTLAVGSNFGAYSFVFPASLAGLLWRHILDYNGIKVRLWEFVKWNTIPVIVTMIVGCLIVAAEVCVIY